MWRFRARSLAVAAVLATVAASVVGVVAVTVDAPLPALADAEAPVSSAFEPLEPARLFDTRTGRGAVPAEPISADAHIDVDVLGQRGIPDEQVTAVVLNVTMTQSAGAGFVTLWAAGTPQPDTSSLNAVAPGQTRANLVTVAAGELGRISVYSSGGTHVLADVVGYYRDTDVAAAGRFIGMTPTRVFDTRRANSPVMGVVAADASIDVSMSSVVGLPPSEVSAVVLNVTGTGALGPGYITAWASGTARPDTSTLNLGTSGATAANLAIVSLGDLASVSFYSETGAHLLADLVGYITDETAPVTSAGLFVQVEPQRVFDTRDAAPPSGRIAALAQRDVAFASAITGVDMAPASVVLNVTAAGASAKGHVTAWPNGSSIPEASTLNLVAGDTRANAAMLALGVGGRLAFSVSSEMHLLADVVGYHLAAPTDPSALPRLGIDDLTYRGAFRLSSDTFGTSNTNYAVGRLAFNSANNSLFIAGHSHHTSVAEFAIPATLGTAGAVQDLPVVEQPLQDFVALLDSVPSDNTDGLDRVTGMYVVDGQLIVNAERWYDAAGTAEDTSLVVRDANDLGGPVDGFFEMDGSAHAGGYMSPIPTEWQDELGGTAVTGWASNSSIISRYSVGPSLFAFDPADITEGDPAVQGRVEATPHLEYPFQGGRYLGADALTTSEGAAPALWNHLSKGVYGFIVPGTRTFMVVGHSGGIDTGIGYKITQDNNNLCGGYCAYGAADEDNYYWLFDLDEILTADSVDAPRPYDYGRWAVPYDGDGQHSIIGATFDAATSTLYMSLSAAGQVGTYDRPPLIVAFDVNAPAS